MKSDNLQYDTHGCWFVGTNDSSTNCLMFHVLFFGYHQEAAEKLGMSDTWSTSRVSHWSSKPAYHIIDCQIF